MSYEILIRGSDDGAAYKGAHCIARAGEMPRAITDAQWPAVCAAINTAAMARVDALMIELGAKQSEYDNLKAELDALKETAILAAKSVVAVVDDQSVTPEQTAIACREIAINSLAPVRRREIAEADAAIQKAIEARRLLDQ